MSSMAILQGAPDAIVCLDDRGIVQAWNGAAERLFGFPRPAAEGQPLQTLLQIEIPVLVSQSNGPSSACADLLCRGADGTLVGAEWSFSAVFDDAGARTATIGIARKLNERRRVERELAQAARAATVSQVTSAIAHRLSQPVGAILITAKTCLRGFERKTLTNDEIVEALGRLSADAARASDMIAQVRALPPASTPERELLSVNEVLRQTLDAMQTEFDGGRIAIRTELAELPLVAADRIQLQQVIANLVANACQSIGMNGDRTGLLRIRSVANGPDEICLEVEDSGPGIPPAMQEQVFAPFVTTRPNGLGLGLSVCRAIVEAHGGRIWVAPSANGARVVFSLPARASTPP
jgi:PAS domain S-box-containing protein